MVPTSTQPAPSGLSAMMNVRVRFVPAALSVQPILIDCPSLTACTFVGYEGIVPSVPPETQSEVPPGPSARTRHWCSSLLDSDVSV